MDAAGHLLIHVILLFITPVAAPRKEKEGDGKTEGERERERRKKPTSVS